LKKSFFLAQSERTLPIRVESMGDDRFRVQRAEAEPPLEVRVLAHGGTTLVTVGTRVVELVRAAKGRIFARPAREAFVASARSLGAAGERPTAESSGPLCAPMPGRIVKLLVAEGDAVVAGAGLVIMEAMKMENELAATRAGVVRRVHVKAGDAVERDAVLLELA
jgi:glutaconyl-CoA/methylmalonyl-CoA decarboxylase subunit gamma